MRQVNACLRIFIILSLLLAASAFLLSARYNNWHLGIVGLVDVVTKAIIVPWLLRLHSAVCNTDLLRVVDLVWPASGALKPNPNIIHLRVLQISGYTDLLRNWFPMVRPRLT